MSLSLSVTKTVGITMFNKTRPDEKSMKMMIVIYLQNEKQKIINV